MGGGLHPLRQGPSFRAGQPEPYKALHPEVKGMELRPRSVSALWAAFAGRVVL